MSRNYEISDTAVFLGTLRQTYAGYQDKGKEGILSLVGVPLPSVVAL
ncbi:hypothetical protein [uncultured Candidatus Kuenenia sp.]|nr:hypothetical protein [uncultured Candidatus Kuenenia sp.]